jgi:hypothetical protein
MSMSESSPPSDLGHSRTGAGDCEMRLEMERLVGYLEMEGRREALRRRLLEM